MFAIVAATLVFDYGSSGFSCMLEISRANVRYSFFFSKDRSYVVKKLFKLSIP
jgi:hypothetical protein